MSISAIQNKLMRRVLLTPELRTLYLNALEQCANSALEAVPGDTRGWLEWEVDREYPRSTKRSTPIRSRRITPKTLSRRSDAVRYFAQHRSEIVKAMVAVARGP